MKMNKLVTFAALLGMSSLYVIDSLASAQQESPEELIQKAVKNDLEKRKLEREVAALTKQQEELNDGWKTLREKPELRDIDLSENATQTTVVDAQGWSRLMIYKSRQEKNDSALNKAQTLFKVASEQARLKYSLSMADHEKVNALVDQAEAEITAKK